MYCFIVNTRIDGANVNNDAFNVWENREIQKLWSLNFVFWMILLFVEIALKAELCNTIVTNVKALLFLSNIKLQFHVFELSRFSKDSMHIS